MKKILGCLMLCFAMQMPAVADQQDDASFQNDLDTRFSRHNRHRCERGPVGPTGPAGATGAIGATGAAGPTGATGPAFEQYASYFLVGAATVAAGDNILFDTQQSLNGITYDSATGVFSLAPGTYEFTYFWFPTGNVNLIVNNVLIPNAPLSGGSVILALTSPINTVSLQANETFTVGAAGPTSSNASISINQID